MACVSLRQRKEQWLITPSSVDPLPELPARSQDSPHDHTNPDEEDLDNPGSKGIMKKSRSFENLRTSERKVTFDGETPPGSCTPSSSPSPTSQLEHPFEGETNPVEVCEILCVCFSVCV